MQFTALREEWMAGYTVMLENGPRQLNPSCIAILRKHAGVDLDAILVAATLHNSKEPAAVFGKPVQEKQSSRISGTNSPLRWLCGKEFNRMHNLMGHMHLHSDSKPFKCLYCPSKFTLKGNLTRHMKVKHGVMERGLHSQGFGRGRIALAQTAGGLRSLEQEEPFDLSQKRRAKGPAFQSDGESARGSSCHEEEDDDDNCYEAERDSPGLGPRRPPLCAPQDLSAKPEPGPRAEGDPPPGDLQPKSRDSPGPEGGQEREFARRDECPGLRALQSTRRGPSFSDYLYFKHRDESLKELLERKMEKQAVLLGI
eukprot:bmy_13421T0